MTKQQYSPSTQAVKDAVLNLYKNDEVIRDSAWELEKDTVVVALCVAAEQGMLSAEHIQGTTPDDWENGWNAAMQYIKTIAKELEETK